MLALRFAAAAFAASTLVAVALGSCGPDKEEIWFCLDPATGKFDKNSPYDANHFDDAGVFDPCHCYDPCGPAPQCPIPVEAGPLPAGCADAGPDAP